jgi:release factor glutamine methyltransferase
MREFLASGVLPEHELVRLATHVSGTTRLDAMRGVELSPDQWSDLDALVRQRLSGFPLQHLEGTVQFGPLELLCDRRALVPRPETEYLWELLVTRLRGRSADVIVDMCTGSGCIALGLKHVFPESSVYGTDIDSEALALAGENVTHTGVAVELRQGDLFGALSDRLRGHLDLLVVNPPYIAESDVAALAVEVRDHDPRVALVAGATGLETYARIADEWIGWMKPGGLLALEIGETQGGELAKMFAMGNPEIVVDLAGRERYLFGVAP